jgi:tRNA A-37 threonylcarbamoyl transferase component Bud32
MMENDSILQAFIRSGFVKKEEIISLCKKEKLFSRKNDVYKVEVESGTGIKLYVLKKYRGEDRHSRMTNELFIYNLLGSNGLKVPRIFYSDEKMIIMEFMDDRMLLDYIIQEENQFRDQKIYGSSTLIEKLPILSGTLDYINDFNKKLTELTGISYILGDMNHRNFLLPAGKVCRVDFEDCCEGKVEEDLGKFIAFFLTYDPSFTTWKRSTAESMKSYCMDNMDVDIPRIDREIEKELGSMIKRRK